MPLSVRSMRVLTAALVAVSAASVSVHAYADDPATQKKKVDAQVRTAQADLDDTSAQLQTAQLKLAGTAKAVASAQAALKTRQTALTSAANRSVVVAGELAAARATESKNSTAISTTAAAQARTTILVGGIARRSYEAGGLGNFALTLQILGADGPDVADQMSTADLLLRQQNGVLTKLAGQQATQRTEGVALASARRRVAGLKIAADNAVADATTARNAAQTAQNAVLTTQRTQTSARNALVKQQAVDATQLKQHQVEAAKLTTLLRVRAVALAKAQRRAAATATRAPAVQTPQPPAATGPAPASARGNGFFTPPMPLSSIVSVFGMRVNPVDGVLRLHAGDDFPYPCGTPVRAAADGTVIFAGSDSIAGGNIVIDHGYVRGQNLASQYEHLSGFVIRSGAVKRGQLIGYSGTTGRSTGCHLHFAVLDNGTYVNPMLWLQ
ncbi:M23 family metallopeptidase [Dermatophilaceae bacterium Sec6.4]